MVPILLCAALVPVSVVLVVRWGIRHIVTPAYTPRWTGKVERFHQTMEREWAKGLRYRNSTARNRALKHWLRHYNELAWTLSALTVRPLGLTGPADPSRSAPLRVACGRRGPGGAGGGSGRRRRRSRLGPR